MIFKRRRSKYYRLLAPVRKIPLTLREEAIAKINTEHDIENMREDIDNFQVKAFSILPIALFA